MNRHHVTRCLLLALLSLLPAGSSPAPPAPAEEDWFLVRLGGTAVGTASERWSTGDDESVFQAQMNVRFTRMGTPLAMSLFTEEVCGPGGDFRRSRMESSVSNLSAHAVLDGDSLRYESSAGGAVRRSAAAWDRDAVSEMVARQCIRSWLAGAAAETTLTLFDISDGGFRRQRLVRGEISRLRVAGEERALVAVDEFDEGATTASSTSWFEASGRRRPMRTVVRQLGVEIEIVRVTATELGSIQMEPSFDIIRQSMVPCPGFPPPGRAEEVTLELAFPGQLPDSPLGGPNQVEVERKPGIVRLRLTREAAERETLPDDDLAEFLRGDRFIQTDAADLRAVADSLRSATRAHGWPLARAVAEWVDGHIEKKGMEHGYASALDVYRSRAGDCTEHSLLTVAVLRAAGIPARPVVGLAYGEAEHSFVGHMWVEAYVDHWRTLDALNLGLDPIRIRVYAPATGEGLGERDLMRAYGAVAGVEIRVVGHRDR